MHVPNLSVNLLSVSEVIKNGYVFLFDAEGCKIYDKENFEAQGEVKMTGSQVNGIYRLDTVDSRSNAIMFNDSAKAHANVIRVTSNLWHRRLGHLNYTDVNRLRDGLATGINFADSGTDELPCVLVLKANNQDSLLR